MAIILCPNCGKEISDKASKCVHCGFELNNHVVLCKECGKYISNTEKECPYCGCPVEFLDDTKKPDAQKVELTKVSVKFHLNKKLLFSVIGTVVVIAVVLICLKINDNIVKQKREQESIEEASRVSEEYRINARNIMYDMISVAADAESCGSLVGKVWNNSIWSTSDTETDQYTKNSYGQFYDDFNNALVDLYTTKSFETKIDNLSKKQSEITTDMKLLANPPEEWKDAYNQIEDFYDDWYSFVSMVVNPSGSYTSFVSKYNELDSGLLDKYNKIINKYDLGF
ncbi:zinc ribbon domain-containing protein [Lachnospira multipara]|uniref:zinc ribbon domain-containing protein n=1 Tax=Lachnospira multipara TaxID=28051 RepID=UPI0004E16A4F|nr:zinc ribbon domain-containing protein [Lachnospira multipara]